jgi:predicted O-linked N-acetylglucosamine transferase (SPINDLY family)
MALGQPNAAVKSYMKALAIEPDYAEAHNNLGITLDALGRFEDAEASYKKALTIAPHFAEAQSNLGDLLTTLKRFNEALVSYKSAFNLKPDITFILGKLLHTKMHLCLWDDLSSMLDELQDKINNNEKVTHPFVLFGLIDDPELQRKATKIFVNENFPKSHDLPRIALYPKHKKIRIGYFSFDFREHPVAALTAELYELHDRKQFEIHAFSYGPDTKDKMNLRIKAGVDHFHDVRTMSHKDVAMLARSLEIDIAVDLGGYTQNARTGIFAMSAAPIQVNYLGYAGTMAANYMDYLIADRTLIPEEKQHHYSEKIAYLPNSFMVNDTKKNLSNRLFTRAEVGLPANGFVFCCFNNHYKITPNIFIGWMRILKAVEGSVLWLTEGNNTAISNLKKEAKKNGVDENRIIFASRLTLREDHLNRIQLADLFIDTLPYNAHATTSDALQVGLPVLTCIGNSFASRVAASLINSVNLPELITNTQEQYESLAMELATHPEKLKTIKKKLNNNLPESPLYDTPLFTQHLESAYSMMYDRYQKGLEADHIYVKH